jgi:class 3 adenylate cyclase
VRAGDKGHEWEILIGLHSGEAVGAIVGTTKYLYDIFGDAVNTAARVQSSCEPARIAISQSTHELVKGDFICHERGAIELKGKGKIPLFYVAS